MISAEFNERDIQRIRAALGILTTRNKEAAIRAAMRYAVKPLESRMRALAPKHSGALSQAIGNRTLSQSARNAAGAAAGAVVMEVGIVKRIHATVGKVSKKRDQGYKARWMEKGTRPHAMPRLTLNPLKRARRKRMALNGKVFSKLHHPGHSPRPFIRPAFEQGVDDSGHAFYQGLQAHMSKKGYL